ncbi:concanavalin A-like lectin/glucanase [Trametopsis cervina]|nr:concanavalin A-like lectin/glucanase [Trametopsis cervina]
MKLLIWTASLLTLAGLVSNTAGASIYEQQARRSSSQCEPFRSTFKTSDASQTLRKSDSFVAVSPEGSYNLGPGGLDLYLEKPDKPVHTKNGVNNIVAEGATINSTFTMLYGKVSFEVVAPPVAGIVTAAILLADQHDEIDIELLGGDPKHWQTNIFAASPKDKEPLWGVFGEIQDFTNWKSSVSYTHNYTIDWNADRIIWSVDGSAVRTLHRCQCPSTIQFLIADTNINGTLHYPSHPTRVQLGIWDASNPAGTSEWARGPIDWSNAPPKYTATFRSITVECPY